MSNSMNSRFVIEYRWTRADGNDIPEDHVEALEESAWDRAVEMAEHGYTSGDLNDYIRMSEDDPEEGVHYQGWWDLKRADLVEQSESGAEA